MAVKIARVVQTCEACPSQWDAWTIDGQYLYLRYRCGIGTVDAYDTSKSAEWTRIPDGSDGRFEFGGPLDSWIDLPEFLDLAGLTLVAAES